MPSTGNGPKSSGKWPFSSALSKRQTIAVLPTPPRPTTVISRIPSSLRKSPTSRVSTWRSWNQEGAVAGGGLMNLETVLAWTGSAGWRSRSRALSMRALVFCLALSGSAIICRCKAISPSIDSISASIRARSPSSARRRSRLASDSLSPRLCRIPSGDERHWICFRSFASAASRFPEKSMCWRGSNR